MSLVPNNQLLECHQGENCRPYFDIHVTWGGEKQPTVTLCRQQKHKTRTLFWENIPSSLSISMSCSWETKKKKKKISTKALFIADAPRNFREENRSLLRTIGHVRLSKNFRFFHRFFFLLCEKYRKKILHILLSTTHWQQQRTGVQEVTVSLCNSSKRKTHLEIQQSLQQWKSYTQAKRRFKAKMVFGKKLQLFSLLLCPQFMLASLSAAISTMLWCDYKRNDCQNTKGHYVTVQKLLIPRVFFFLPESCGCEFFRINTVPVLFVSKLQEL